MYQRFDVVTKLTKNYRLDKNDPDAVRYNDFLLRLRNGANTKDDWNWIKKCCCSKFSMNPEGWKAVSTDMDTVHLYATNKEVAEVHSKT